MNIAEIARLADVSRATVSRFLNNGYVSKENKEKIQAIIKKTGYIPSSHAQTLRTKKTNLIGVIVPKISSESVSRMVSGITVRLQDTGYNILLGNTNLDTKKELEYLNIFKTKQVDGILFIATVLTEKHYAFMKSIQVPIVVIGQKANGFSSVYHDDFNAAKDAVSYMIQNGAKNIAFLGVTDADAAAGLARKNGYLSALTGAGLQHEINLIKHGAFHSDFGYQATIDCIHSGIPTDGIFCATDTIAVGCIRALNESHIKIGKEVQVIGVGDSNISRIITPSLTTVHLHYHTAGQEACAMLLDSIIASSSILKDVMLGYELIIRKSSEQY